jgi:hypothetical protein
MKKTGKGGRPTKLTPELVDELLSYLRMGVTIKSAYDAAGINEATYRRWVVGSKEFCAEATRTRSKAKIALISQILSNKDWRAKAWYLERCWPAEFARTEDRRLPGTEAAAAAAAERMPPLTIVLSTPDGKKRETTFKEAQKILCGGFPIRNEPPDESELGNGDGIDIEPRFNP